MRRAVKILHVLYKSDTYGKLLQIDQINMISDYSMFWSDIYMITDYDLIRQIWSKIRDWSICIYILMIWICWLKTNLKSIVDDIMRTYLSSVTLMNSPDLNVSSLSSAASKSYRALTCNKQFSLIGMILYWNTVYREIFASLYIFISPFTPFGSGWIYNWVSFSFIIHNEQKHDMFEQF